MKTVARPKLVLAGYFGAGNVGDEAILSSQIKILKHDFDLTILSTNPKETRKTFHVVCAKLPSISAPNEMVKFFSLIACSDGFILGGGGFLANKLQPFSIYYWLFLISVAKLFQKKVILFSVGCGPFKSGIHAAMIRLGLNRADIILLRDKTSEYILRQIIHVKAPLKVTADMAFLLNQEHFIENNSLTNLISHGRAPLVLFVLCPRFQNQHLWKGDKNRGRYHQYVVSMAQLADFVVEEVQGTPVFLPFYPGDVRFYGDIFRNMRNRERVMVLEHAEDMNALLTLFRKVELVIGARYHSILFSIIAGTPVLPIVYQHKCYAIAKETSLQYLEIGDNIEWPNKNIDLLKAKTIILEICKNNSKYRNQIRMQREKLTLQATENLQVLKQMLNGSSK